MGNRDNPEVLAFAFTQKPTAVFVRYRPKAAPGARQNSHSIGRRYLPERGQSTQCRLLSKHVVNGSGEINLFPLREWLNNQLDPPRAMHALRNDMDS